MEKNYSKLEMIRQDALRRCFAALIAYKNSGILKQSQIHLKETPSCSIVSKFPEINEQVASMRSLVEQIQFSDPLEFKKADLGCSKNKIHLFHSYNGRTWTQYDNKRYWVKDFLNAYRNNDISLIHYKQDYFLIDDKFYAKADYLCVDGKPYSKEEWVLTDGGELIELAKCLQIFAKYHHWRQDKGFETSYWLKAKDDEEFVCENDTQRESWVVRIIGNENFDNSTYGARMLYDNFFSTLFRVGKKRYFSRGNSYGNGLKLTPEMLINLEYDPTEEHKKAWRHIFEEAAKFKNRYGRDSLPHMKEDGNDVAFVMEFNCDKVKSAGIKDKIIRSLCDDNRSVKLTLGGLLNRLAVLKDIYKTEMKYDKSNKQDDSQC